MSETWVCKGCGRTGTSYIDLLTQGCEGKPERLSDSVPAIVDRPKDGDA